MLDTDAMLAELYTMTPGTHEHTKLRADVIVALIPLAKSQARQYANRGVELDDLIQVACIRLIHAVDRFDPTRGIKFASYASPSIRGEIQRCFRDNAWATKVSRTDKERSAAVYAAELALEAELQRTPTNDEVAERLGIPVSLVVDSQLVNASFRALREPEHFDSMMDTTDTDLVETQAVLAPLLAGLTDLERRVVHLRYYGNQTQKQVGEQLGMSQMAVSRLLARVIETLREGASAAS